MKYNFILELKIESTVKGEILSALKEVSSMLEAESNPSYSTKKPFPVVYRSETSSRRVQWKVRERKNKNIKN